MPASNLLLASKVVVTESPPSVRNIPGVPTAIAAMVGTTKRGPVGTPVFVDSFKAFVNAFGSYLSSSDAPQAVQGFFSNGGTQLWFTRTLHYTDVTSSSSGTGVQGTQTLEDRGSTDTAAVLTSVAGPFDLRVTGLELELKFDAAGAQSVTFTALPASVTTGNATFVLTNGMTLVFKSKLPGSSAYTPLYTVTFSTAQFSNIAAATAQEVVNAINSSLQAVGISAQVSTSAVKIQTDKKGSGAALTLDASSTALTALTLVAGATTGTGNVADVDAVTAAEIASLFTALPLTTGTVVASGSQVVATGVVTGATGQVQATTNTTATGIFSGSLPITVNGSDSAAADTITVSGKDPGTYIESASIVISDATSGDSDAFNLVVSFADGTTESWPNLSMDPTATRYVETIINDPVTGSIYISVEDLLDAATPPENLPAKGTFSVWADADDGLSGLADTDFVGSQAGGTGIFSFDVVDNITLLGVPGRATSAVHNAMVTYCEVSRAKTCFAVLDCPANQTAQAVKAYVTQTALLEGISEEAAIFWPRIKVLNPSTAVFGGSAQITVPPSGHIMGVMARADASKPGGVYEAPAGLDQNFGVIFGALGVDSADALDESLRDVVYPSLINPITSIDGSPFHVDGHRTLKADGNFPSIPERRGVNFIELSLKKGTIFAKHRNNDRRLRMEVKRSVDAFLLRQYEVGAFRGNTPGESFTTNFSDEINPDEVVFAGQLKGEIGLATQKPADFIILDFSQDTRALDARLATLGASTNANQ